MLTSKSLMHSKTSMQEGSKGAIHPYIRENSGRRNNFNCTTTEMLSGPMSSISMTAVGVGAAAGPNMNPVITRRGDQMNKLRSATGSRTINLCNRR